MWRHWEHITAIAFIVFIVPLWLDCRSNRSFLSSQFKERWINEQISQTMNIATKTINTFKCCQCFNIKRRDNKADSIIRIKSTKHHKWSNHNDKNNKFANDLGLSNDITFAFLWRGSFYIVCIQALSIWLENKWRKHTCTNAQIRGS